MPATQVTQPNHIGPGEETEKGGLWGRQEPPDFEAIPSDVAEYARVRLGETPERRTQMLDELRELIYQRGDITPLKMDDDYLLKFLRARNFKLEATYRLLRNYCNFREINWDYYDVNPLDLAYLSDEGVLSVLPYRDQYGRRIINFRLGKWDLLRTPVEELLKATVAVIEVGTQEPRAQVLGGVAIFDMEDFTMAHVCQVTPSVASKVIEIMVTSLPYKVGAIHIVNESWMFSKIFAAFRPFLSEKYREMAFFHGNNMKSLHEHIEPKYLPEIYGGIRPDNGYADWMRSFMKEEYIIKEMRALGYQMDKEE